MAAEGHACEICGRPAPEVDGWAARIPGYRLVRAPWRSGDRWFVDGPLHFSCLRELPDPGEFSREFTAMATGSHEPFEVEIGGAREVLARNGLDYRTEIFSGELCRIFRHGTMNRWLVVEHSGPWYGLDQSQLKEIAAGRPVRSAGGETVFVMPEDPGDDIYHWGLGDLLGHLGVLDRYPALIDQPDLAYEFFEYYPPKRVLAYFLVNTVPLPEEAVAFLRDYAARYEPVRYPEDH
ncbi:MULTISPECIES: hypothetical protein [Streptomycetaceae]|uniref:Uncharacterized protein n=1 Tax=Streptantibioticus cattleyicolor (strain ATCC 35852 / DSM 46488 / JCM 4925 / NBRC 14057 / NRRL 8057) TaxID=1003195 RepID=F8JR85_STREN|nr:MULTISPECIES: hypothetical protein [Streptomycetaceae]AEW95387.1 hypothetical protein SCATT_30160 [Streptantibioticus cattleyicolor NRRL 8057 = DSM 46488]MYS59958.1 hypothetical protein [Streptomyces sp. SID5468]CCB75730.1 protein of unknown function [Streptantibioticus cattleyicolor NRRL 8057 = DSM 46488]